MDAKSHTEKNTKLHAFRLLLPYILEYKYLVLASILCLVLGKFASISLPFFLKFIVDKVETTNVTVIAPIGLVFAYGGARLINILLNEARDLIFGKVTEYAIRRVGLKTFGHLLNLDLSFHIDRRTGGLSRDIERGTGSIEFILQFGIFNIIPTLLEVAIVAIILHIQYGFLFSSITLISVTTYIAYTIAATEWSTQYIRKSNEADNAASNHAIDSLLNYETIKYFTNEEYELARYDRELSDIERTKRTYRVTLFVMIIGQTIIVSAATIAMLSLAAMNVSDGIMTIGDFVLINAFLMQLFIPLNSLGFIYKEIKGAFTNIERLFDILNISKAFKEEANAKVINPSNTSITFKGVSFSYQHERPILNAINFHMAPGKTTAVVGESGAGKSTLVKLLFRFYDCSAGEVIVGGENIKDVKLKSLRQAIGVVPQDTVLFNDTILENIRYGRPSATDEEIIEAVKLSHLDTFIEKLPDGMNTVVGERGLKVSGGEKQRIAIARTLLKRPAILVFDEATSSLDTQTEASILANIDEVSREYTTLVIAHRLSTVINAEEIIVLDNGGIYERGTHQELIAKQGLYQKMWLAQQEKKLSCELQ